MTRIVCVVMLIVATVVGPSYACTCAPRSVEEMFCTAQFASVFFVKDCGEVIGGEMGVRRYSVDLIYQYRTVLGPMAEPGNLYTPAVSSACGVTLEQGFYYVITGYYEPSDHPWYSRMTTNLCELVIKFSYNPLYTFDRPDCEEFNTYAVL